MKIQIENRQSRFSIQRRSIRHAVSKILKFMDCADHELSILFTDDAEIRDMNKKYLGKDKPTNVISFSLREGEYGNVHSHILGDVVISLDTAHRDAVKGGLSLEQEIHYLLIHGILHLLGFNHENTSRQEALRMTQKEKELFYHLYGKNEILS